MHLSRTLLPLLLVLTAPGPLRAQSPGSFGTAAGLAGTAVTEARRADAAGWNPALAGVYDGPVRTSSVLGLDLRSLPGGGMLSAAGRLGLLDGHAGEKRFTSLARSLPKGGRELDASAQIRWVAVQSGALAITVDTRYAAQGALPDSLARGLGARGVGPEVWTGRPVERSLASVLTVGRGVYLGELPVVGRLWSGVGLKGWWLHSYARGRFEGDLPSADVYHETALGNAGGVGADLGVAGVAGRLWYGISVSNAYVTSFRPGRGARGRSVEAARSGGGLTLVEHEGAVIEEDDPDAAAVADARALWERARYPSVLRAGASWQSPWGSFAAALSETVRDGGLDPVDGEAPRTLAWQDPAKRVRLSYGWGDDHGTASVGVALGRCDRRWTAGVRRQAGGEFGISLDLSLSDFACNLHPSSR